jgi:hypothetical protein
MLKRGEPGLRTAPDHRHDETAFAVCRECGAEIPDWRERLLPIDTAAFALTERGELALHIEHAGACSACSGGSVEIRVEAARSVDR